MSSPPPQPCRVASPEGELSQKRSQFTYRNLGQMASYIPSCPLRVIAHIDLDCFYAQAEMVRLGVPEDQPLAVQQWWACSFSSPSLACLPAFYRISGGELTTDDAKARAYCRELSCSCFWDWSDVLCNRGKEIVSQHHQPACCDLAGRG